jgi:hypothetical protein
MGRMEAFDRRFPEYPLIRLHIVVLLASWLAGTVLVLVANSTAPTTPPVPITAEYLATLRGSWAWYGAGYALFFVADCAIALLGIPFVAWLRAEPGFRGPAIVVLFVLSGTLGALADVAMMGAAQLFRIGSPLLAPALAAAWLDGLNAACNWLSATSLLPAGIGTWLACAAAVRAGVGRGWIAFNRFAALYQIVTGLLAAAAFLVPRAVLTDLALLAVVVVMPILAVIWLVWMLREMKIQPPRSLNP